MEFDFVTDNQSHDFCMSIASNIAQKYGISLTDAILRINRLWAGTTFSGENDIIYHRPENYWVDHIYSFYEDCVRDGTENASKEFLLDQQRQLWERWRNNVPPDIPSNRAEEPT